MNDMQPFRLFDLPPEIRLQIFEAVFRGLKINAYTDFPYYPPKPLLVNKQLYSESVKAFYSEAIFYICYSEQIRWLLQAIKPHQHLIHCVRVGPIVLGGHHESVNEKFARCTQEMERLEMKLKDGVIQIGVSTWEALPTHNRRTGIAWMNESGEEMEWESVKGADGRFGVL